MPVKRRHAMVSLGSISGIGSTPEVDIESADRIILYLDRDTSGEKLVVEVSPEPFGESATWYVWGAEVPVGPGAVGKVAVKIPWETYGPQMNSARRIRFRSTDSGADVSGIYLELIRSIG